ncbi:MAG: glycosyltransferase family 2 protein [Bacteroidales bacterium]|nr:glycosyltransferase family 2 protein [Bacteroidales bacterium]
MSTFLSIIIPVYNVAPYLRQCVDSILCQADQGVEVILVDDGSSDGSAGICDEYARQDNRIRVFHQGNSGASAARNFGIEQSCGEWISFVDADDWVADDYFATFKAIENKADITFFPAFEVFSNVAIKLRRLQEQRAESRSDIEQCLYNLKYGAIGDIFGWTWAKFIRANIIRDYHIRFVSELVFREDEIFTMDICCHVHSVCVLNKPLYNYRITNLGLTGRGISIQDRLLLAENIERNLPYFKHVQFRENEQRRVADYRLEVFRTIARIRNLHRTLCETHSFFRKNPVFLAFATDGRLAKMLSHTFVISYCLILTDFLLEAVRGKLK